MSGPVMRECNKCHRLLIWPVCFVSTFRKKEGRRVVYLYCKLCRQASTRAWQGAHADRVRAYRARYYADHKAQFREYYDLRKAGMKEEIG